MKNSSISVVIPCYNAEATIEKCLRALSQQTLAPREIIVVDDGSTDNTVALAAPLAVVMHNARRKGPAGARNTGVEAARGDIIAFTDSDCVPPPRWLERMADALRDPNVGAVGGGYARGADDSFWQVFCCEELAFRRRHRAGSVHTLVSNNMACRKHALLEVGGFPEAYPVCEDMLVSDRIARRHTVLWLQDNGVQHHFQTSLAGFLRHQYFFGAESTRFFLQNRGLLARGNHQGRRLHFCMMLALGASAGVVLSIVFWIAGSPAVGCWLSAAAVLALIAHLSLYAPMMRHLRRRRCPAPAKAYAASLLRDICCGPAFFDGIIRAWRTRRKPASSPNPAWPEPKDEG